jgi:hypothetical protein
MCAFAIRGIAPALRGGAMLVGLGLVACGSGAAPPPRAAKVDKQPPPPKPPAPRAPSPYERRWLSACSEGGTLGHCPAPFDRPAVFVDVEAQGDDPPPAFCGATEPSTGADARAALAAKRRALRACFRGAEDGAWVEIGRNGAPAPAQGPERPARTAACVAKIVEQALAGISTGALDRVVVLNGGAPRAAAEALSKQSIDEVITSHGGEVNACYDGALEVWPGLRGRIASSVVIWFDGSVALVRTGESSLGNPALECCINTAVSGWRFGQPAEGAIVIVSLPFLLGPAQ